MPNRNIYVLEGGAQDLSRWLRISRRENGDLVLHLTDLCQPGCVSTVQQVVCPSAFFAGVLTGGTVQLSAESGYVLLRPNGEELLVEFRGDGDPAPTKVVVGLADVRERLDAAAPAAV